MIAKIADGLMLPGGQDVSPLKFGLPNTAAYSTCMKRDTFEIALIEEFMALDKPVFGICRGFQLICLYMKYIAGLKVMEEFQWHQHLKGHAQDQQHIARGESYHYVDIYSEDGKVSVELTNSLHHQGMVSSPHIRPDESDDILGTGFSDLNNQNKDFVLEHMEFANTKVSGVQWHPECMSFRHQQKYVGEFFDRMLNK